MSRDIPSSKMGYHFERKSAVPAPLRIGLPKDRPLVDNATSYGVNANPNLNTNANVETSTTYEADPVRANYPIGSSNLANQQDTRESFRPRLSFIRKALAPSESSQESNDLGIAVPVQPKSWTSSVYSLSTVANIEATYMEYPLESPQTVLGNFVEFESRDAHLGPQDTMADPRAQPSRNNAAQPQLLQYGRSHNTFASRAEFPVTSQMRPQNDSADADEAFNAHLTTPVLGCNDTGMFSNTNHGGYDGTIQIGVSPSIQQTSHMRDTSSRAARPLGEHDLRVLGNDALHSSFRNPNIDLGVHVAEPANDVGLGLSGDVAPGTFVQTDGRIPGPAQEMSQETQIYNDLRGENPPYHANYTGFQGAQVDAKQHRQHSPIRDVRPAFKPELSYSEDNPPPINWLSHPDPNNRNRKALEQQMQFNQRYNQTHAPPINYATRPNQNATCHDEESDVDEQDVHPSSKANASYRPPINNATQPKPATSMRELKAQINQNTQDRAEKHRQRSPTRAVQPNNPIAHHYTEVNPGSDGLADMAQPQTAIRSRRGPAAVAQPESATRGTHTPAAMSQPQPSTRNRYAPATVARPEPTTHDMYIEHERQQSPMRSMHRDPYGYVQEHSQRQPSPARATGEQLPGNDNYYQTPHNVQNPRQQESSARGDRRRSRSPCKVMPDVVERDEPIERASPVPSPPKRSRSPHKKLFGPKGWLGFHPDEAKDIKRNASEPLIIKEKKPKLIDRAINFVADCVEKIDLSPGGKAIREPAPTTLQICMPGPAQAGVFMEIELMLLYTGNRFLMNAFSEGLLDFDTVKKAAETWKSKGRPMVTQFNYDQETQRKLIVVNQDRLRFNSPVHNLDRTRILTLLQAWKKNINIMSVRTLCNPDAVVRLLLKDSALILEVLGADEKILVRLQNVRLMAEHIILKNGPITTHPINLAEYQPPQNLVAMHAAEANMTSTLPSNNSYGASESNPGYGHFHYRS